MLRTSPIGRPLRILFFGSDEFSVIHLRALFEERERGKGNGLIGDLEVVSHPDQLVGRGLSQVRVAPLKKLALDLSLKIHEAPVSKSLKEWQVPFPPPHVEKWDMGVVVSFGYFLTIPVLQSFNLGTLNVHPSLLPKFRGAAPIQHAIMKGEKETGVSVIELHPSKWDAGRILSQTKLPIPENSTFHSLMPVLAEQGARDLLKCISNFPELSAKAQIQNESEVTKAPKLNSQLGNIVWEHKSAQEIIFLRNAIEHQYPLYSHFQGKRILLKDLALYPSSPTNPIFPENEHPGSTKLDKDQKNLLILCRDRSVLGCPSFQVGAKKLSALDFACGYLHNKKGIALLAPS